MTIKAYGAYAGDQALESMTSPGVYRAHMMCKSTLLTAEFATLTSIRCVPNGLALCFPAFRGMRLLAASLP